MRSPRSLPRTYLRHLEWLDGAAEYPMLDGDWTSISEEHQELTVLLTYLPDGVHNENETLKEDKSVEQRSYALLLALRQNDLVAVDCLLNDTIDPNYAQGSSLLMVAAYRGLASVCRCLIAAGADPLYRSRNVDSESDSETEGAFDRARMSGDAETKFVVECASVGAFWSFLLDIKSSDPGWFYSALDSLQCDATRLGMLSLASEMQTHRANDDSESDVFACAKADTSESEATEYKSKSDEEIYESARLRFPRISRLNLSTDSDLRAYTRRVPQGHYFFDEASAVPAIPEHELEVYRLSNRLPYKKEKVYDCGQDFQSATSLARSVARLADTDTLVCCAKRGWSVIGPYGPYWSTAIVDDWCGRDSTIKVECEVDELSPESGREDFSSDQDDWARSDAEGWFYED